jgi:hypothetical protein
MSDELKTVDNNSLVSSPKAAQRIEKINHIVDEQSEKILTDLDVIDGDLSSIMSLLMDRVALSTEPGYPIALARIGELRVEAMKKKIDVLKTLVTDKSNEMSNTKKKSGGDISDIMNGIGFGAALGATISNNNAAPQQHISQSPEPFEVIDVSAENNQDIEIQKLLEKNK